MVMEVIQAHLELIFCMVSSRVRIELEYEGDVFCLRNSNFVVSVMKWTLILWEIGGII